MKFGNFNAQINKGALSFATDGVVINARTFVELLSRVRDHRMKSGGDLASGWQHRVGTEYCEQHPDCGSCTDFPAEIKKVVSVGDMRLFFKAVKDWLKSGEGFCDPELAESRAAICSTCPYNVEISGCGACFRLAEVVSETLGKRVTSQESTLYGCMGCGCNLKVKVWCPPDVVAGTLQKEKLPPHCWQILEGQTDI